MFYSVLAVTRTWLYTVIVRKKLEVSQLKFVVGFFSVLMSSKIVRSQRAVWRSGKYYLLENFDRLLLYSISKSSLKMP
jgi:hypothetical protein